MAEYVDWPDGPAEPVGLAVLLPGRSYPATMPLLTFTGRAARQHGWRVRAVSWSAPDLDTEATTAWVGRQLEEAVVDVEGRVLVVGKSLGTCAAAQVAEHGCDAIWLTPLLHLPPVVAAMADHPGRQLLIGGTEDPAWNLAAARSTGGDVAQVDGGDHAMSCADAVRTATMHVEVTRAVDAWLRTLE